MRPDLPPAPARIAKLPVDHRGYPVPAFVANGDDGKPDFRVVRPDHLARCWVDGLCWICGEPMGRYRTFVIGPMCAVNLISSEPPSHHDCATWAAQACPFLVNPNKGRGEAHMPEGSTGPPGIMVRRNPGVTLLWTVLRGAYSLVRVEGGVLFHIGTPPEEVEWYREGRTATRAEVLHSIDTGLPLLAEADDNDPEALAAIDRAYQAALRWVPAA